MSAIGTKKGDTDPKIAAPRHRRAPSGMSLRLPRRILVGYDGRSGAADALVMAARLAELSGAGLTLAAIESDRRAAPTWPELESGVRDALGERVFRMLAYRAESVPAGLQAAAEREAADLIVLGSTSRGMLGRVLPGGVGERVLHHAPCSVGVAPRGYVNAGRHRLRAVGTGYDGSPEAAEALRTAAALARAAGGALRIVTVVEPPHQLLAGLPREEALAMVREGFMASRHRRWMRDRLDDGLMEVLWELAVDGKLLEGSAADALRSEAGGLDLMVLGSRGGYGQARRLLMGSTAVAAMRGAACPTIIVPRG